MTRRTTAHKIFAKALCAWVTCLGTAHAEDISATLEQGPWISNRAILEFKQPEFPETKYPFADMLKQAFVKGLANPDQQRAVLKLQNDTGTKPKEYGEGYLGPRAKILADANATHGTRWRLFTNMKTYAGKEMHFDFVPESIKKGFRFDQTEGKTAKVASGITGTPVKYTLKLQDIEPAEDELLIASVDGDDLEYLQYAPKASLDYTIEQTDDVTVGQAYNFNYAPDAPEYESFDWKKIVPDRRFRGKLTPRGAPTAAKPLPDQTLTIEQVQGLYSAEIQFVNGLHKQSMLHRFRAPIGERLAVTEEFSETWKPTKVSVNDMFYTNTGFSSIVEHYFLEKRYRAGLILRRGLKSMDIYANLPEAGLNSTRFSRLQRWELAFNNAI